MILIGDVHGCYDTLVALLDKIPQEEKDKGIVFCGDLIDRGPKSRQVVDLVKKMCEEGKAYCVKGNHEDMMVSTGMQVLQMMATYGRYIQDSWVVNGGGETIDSYMVEVNGEMVVDLTAFEEHVEWMESLPIYLEFPEIKGDDGRYLVASHSHVANVWKFLKDDRYKSQHPLKNLLYQILWGRPHKLDQQHNQEIYNVIGHTPLDKGPKVKSFYANIDTGCFVGLSNWSRRYKTPDNGKLTAISFPEKQIYQQDCIDKRRVEDVYGEDKTEETN